jgi:polypeptide N-acetylgalactosaminyltransferase
MAQEPMARFRIYLGLLFLLCRVCTAAETQFPYPPDTRPKACQKVKQDFSDNKVSIVIPWHQEKWLHLRDTLLALLHFTPEHLVEEFIFISDGNKDTKETELKAISSKVKVLAFEERQGLIRAKSRGVDMAKGPVIMFLEAHCIVNRDWLPPLLERLVAKPKAIVMPVLDFIDPHNWNAYYPGGAGIHWRFEWNMNLINSNPGGILKHDNHKPYISPGTSGGIFVMRKAWFHELGFFDEGMLEWGGDHVELSFKTWRCGGRIEIVPCSRIGHLFREPATRPYNVDTMQVVKNYARLAQVWWKDHLSYFYRMKPEAVGMEHEGMDGVLERYEELTQRLNCKNHSWYLENIDHEGAWELDRICHPYLKPGHPDLCKGKTAPGRFTITERDVIPKMEYLKRRKAVSERLKAAKNSKGATHASDEL